MCMAEPARTSVTNMGCSSQFSCTQPPAPGRYTIAVRIHIPARDGPVATRFDYNYRYGAFR